jgi:GT2 family glycosyltransferase
MDFHEHDPISMSALTAPSTQLDSPLVDASISIVVLTHNRCNLVRQCVENVLRRTSAQTSEIVIWNNASTDDTAAYLATIRDSRIRVVNSDRNVGVNAYARAFAKTRGQYLIELDDDVIDAPQAWDARLLYAIQRLPDFGYIAANLAADEHDVQARLMYGLNAHLYRSERHGEIDLKVNGPIGGWCAITSRRTYESVGGLGERRRVFWLEDEAYVERVGRLGLRAGYLDDLKVRHAGGPHYGATSEAKLRFLRSYARRRARRNAFKRMLLSMPIIRTLNDRNSWFEPPRQGIDYIGLYSTWSQDRISSRNSASGSRQ